MIFPELHRFPYFSFDTETTGMTMEDRVFGFSISTPDGMDYYWDIRDQPESVHAFNCAMQEYTGTLAMHNLPFDYKMGTLSNFIIPLRQCVDTVVRACLINEHEMAYSLDYLAKKYCKSFKKGDELYSELAKLFGGRATKNVQMKNISKAPASVVAPYAKGDTRSTLELYEWQLKEIERQGLQSIVNFEQSITPHLIKTQMRGIRVDIPAAEKAVGELHGVCKHLQKQLDDIAGFKCNPQPGKSMAKLFEPKWRDGRWWANDGTPLEETGSGNFSLNADALRLMSHPAAKVILELRSMIKTRDTFLMGHVLESAVNGRVYPSINQTKGDEGGTGTGRLSYTTPALQQIPDRNKKVASIVKPIFLPEEGHSWVDADMASFEVRVFAHLVGTKDIVDAYLADPETDFHQYVSELTGLPRNATYSGEPNAKQLNLSMIFNQGNGTTAEKMEMPWSWESFIPQDSKDGKEIVYKKAGPEAMAVIGKYHDKLPGVQKLAKGCKAKAEERGYIFTRYGRHLRFPRGYKSYKASGLLIQATSADENKRNWAIINEALDGTGGEMLLNTHDSYSLSLPIGEEEKLARQVKEMIEQDRGLRVPLILEVQHPGENWWASKSTDRWM